MRKTFKFHMGSVLFLTGVSILWGCAMDNHKNNFETVDLKSKIKIEQVELKFDIVIGETASKQKFYLGGFSGMYIPKIDDTGSAIATNHLIIWTLTDRGINGGDVSFLSGAGRNARPFLLPEFSPKLVSLDFDQDTGKVELGSIIDMKMGSQSLTGLPQQTQTKKNRSYVEVPVDGFGNRIKADRNGVDSESICIDSKKNFWVGEEYGPDLIKFDSEGRLLKRYRPGLGLPEVLKFRKTNRGFEGVACLGSKIYAILQSPLKLENSKTQKIVRMIEFDSLQEKTTSMYLYVLEDEKIDKLGDLTTLPNGDFLTVEQNGKTGLDSRRKIFKISFLNATNILSFKKNPELLDSEELKMIAPVQKKLIVDLSDTVVNKSEKIEGLSILDNYKLLLISDNDYGLSGEVDFSTGLAKIDNEKKSYLYKIELDQPIW